MSLLTADPHGKPFRCPWNNDIFESRATEYPRAATQGTWEEAFD